MKDVEELTGSAAPSSQALRALFGAPGLLAVLLLLINDHVLKVAFPSPLTGKLSDFAGLFFAPYVLLTLAFFVSHRGARILTGLVYAAVAVAFTALKASTETNHAIVNTISNFIAISVVPDPTDLVAVAALPLSYVHLHRPLTPRTGPQRKSLRYAILTSALFAMTATSSAQPTIEDIAADGVRPGSLYATLRYTNADGLYEMTEAAGSWKRITTKTGSIVTHPRIARVLFLIGTDGWDPSLDRIDASSGDVVSITPPNPGPRPSYVEFVGQNALGVGAWSTESLFFLRHGELLRTNDGGRNWTSSLSAVRAFATTNRENTVYALSRFGYLYRSDDAGKNWSTTISTFAMDDLGRLAVDPHDPDLLLATAGNGLWRSQDGGHAWERTLLYSGGSQYARWRIEFDPSSDRIYVLFGYGGLRLMRSDDRGRTWHESGIDAGDFAVDSAGEPFVVGAQLTRVLRGREMPNWREVTGNLPVK